MTSRLSDIFHRGNGAVKLRLEQSPQVRYVAAVSRGLTMVRSQQSAESLDAARSVRICTSDEI